MRVQIQVFYLIPPSRDACSFYTVPQNLLQNLSDHLACPKEWSEYMREDILREFFTNGRWDQRCTSGPSIWRIQQLLEDSSGKKAPLPRAHHCFSFLSHSSCSLTHVPWGHCSQQLPVPPFIPSPKPLPWGVIEMDI